MLVLASSRHIGFCEAIERCLDTQLTLHGIHIKVHGRLPNVGGKFLPKGEACRATPVADAIIFATRPTTFHSGAHSRSLDLHLSALLDLD